MRTEPNNAYEYRILREMSPNNALSLLAPSANRVFQVVDYEDSKLHEELSTLDPGKLVELRLDRISDRSNVWRANWADGVESLIPTR